MKTIQRQILWGVLLLWNLDSMHHAHDVRLAVLNFIAFVLSFIGFAYNSYCRIRD